MITLKPESILVGVDVHKYSHTAVALDAWGQEKGRFDFSNDVLNDYTLWLNSLGDKENIVVGLEDTNCYGVRMVEKLGENNFHIRYVPAILTERERKSSTKRQKSDYVDAKRVARVILTKYEETLPAKESIADEEELRTCRILDLLLMERRDLVRHKTILKNQLHALLHQYYGDHYSDEFPKTFHSKALGWYLKDLKLKKGNVLATGIVRRIDHLLLIQDQIENIDNSLKEKSKKSKEAIALHQNIHGCGIITATSIMAELVTIKRFLSKEKLASYAGVAPTERSSGRKRKLYTNPFGNRRLNKALHTIALSQIACKGDERGRTYYQKKLKEGKTKLWALRCLKRQISNRVFQVLKNS
jgi:transposase